MRTAPPANFLAAKIQNFHERSAMRGRKPVPAPVLRARGTFRRARHDGRAIEPLAPGDLREAPVHLTASQQELWRFAIANAPANIVRSVDYGVLAAYVVALDQHKQATELQ